MARIYFLAVLLTFLGFFGCMQFRKCDEAGLEDCGKQEKFENNLKCTWDKTANDNRGKCVKATN